MLRKRFVHILCAFALLALLAACVQNGSSTPASGGRHPFRVDMAGEDGARVSWQGETDGYQPGTAETMHLAIDNDTGQTWSGRFCVQLLEPMPSSVVIPLAEQEFSLESDGGFSQDVRVELPADLPLGIHGLALTVHEPTGPIVDVTTVQVGEGENEPFQGDWPIEVALDSCSAPQSASDGRTPQPGETSASDEGQPASGRIRVDSVEVTATQVAVKCAMTKASPRQEVGIKAHLNAVGVIDLLTGVFFTVVGMLVSLGVLLFGPWINGAALWQQEGGIAALVIMLSVSGAFLALGVPSLIAGIGLLKHESWARILAIVLAIVALTSIPIGTVAGIYALWVLTKKETERLLGAAS